MLHCLIKRREGKDLIEVIHEVGKRSLLNKNTIVEGLTLPVPKKKKGKKQHVVIIDFNLRNQNINLSIVEVSDHTPLDYLWVGNADGANSPQWYGTTTNVEYLLNQTIPNLLQMWPGDDLYYQKLEQVLNTFFLTMKIDKRADERYKYVADPSLFHGELSSTKAKEAKSEIVKLFHSYLKQNYSFVPEDIALYSLSIDGERLVDHSVYQKLILNEKESVFEKGVKGICSVTGIEGVVTGTVTKMQFKYYVNDKANFASGFNEKNFIKNLAISKQAYRDILAGEAYIQRNLDTRFGRLPCYIIPSFLYDPADERLSIDNWSQAIKKLADTANTLETTAQLDRDIRNDIRHLDHMNRVALHFLFYVKSQSSFKVAKLIQDVPMIHVHGLVKRLRKLDEMANHYFGSGYWKLGFNQIFFLIPMKELRGDSQEKRKILTVYEALLSHKHIDYQWLVNQFVQLAKIYYFEQFETYQFSSPKKGEMDLALVRVLLQTQLLLYLLKDIQCLKGVKGMETVTIQLNDEQMVNYIQTMNYNDAQIAMFLLGTLVASVAVEQQRNLSNKAVLNKINFQGMNKTKIQMFSVEIFEKLKQYKLLNMINETVYAEHKRLFDSVLDRWPLSDREAVFFLLSGYAYKTNQIFKSSQAKKQQANG